MEASIDRVIFTYLSHLRHSGRPQLPLTDPSLLQRWRDAAAQLPESKIVLENRSQFASAPIAPQPAPVVSQPLPESDSWQQLEADLENCQRCPLAGLGRKHIVLGEGNRNAHVMLVGEGPSFDEDRQGRPFVGRSGQKLDQIMQAVGFCREELYIANAVKCRPPGNRNPASLEMVTCQTFLQRQIRLIRPRLILALGKFAANFFYGESDASRSLASMREKILPYSDDILVVVTYHPSALLRNESLRKPVWDDVRVLRNLYDDGRHEPLRFPAELRYPVEPQTDCS